MEYAVNYIYDDGDNATYLHPTYTAAHKEKEESVEDLIENYAEMGYDTDIIHDSEDDTIIRYSTIEEPAKSVRIVVSRIYE